MTAANTSLILMASNYKATYYFKRALLLLTKIPNLSLIKKSNVVFSEDELGLSDAPYANMAIELTHSYTAIELKQQILQPIESACDRIRAKKTTSPIVSLDLDLCFFNNETFKTNELNIPCPLVCQYWHRLQPIASIAPDYIHPTHHKTLARLLEDAEKENPGLTKGTDSLTA